MLKLLCNTIGDDLTSVTYTTSAVATGYDGNDAISGPRNYRVRGIPQTIGGSGYTNPFSLRYNGTGCTGIDHVVVTDFDLNIPDPASNGFDLQYNNGSWNSIRNEAPLSTALIGINMTDLVYVFSPVTIAGSYIFYFTPWVQRPYTSRASEFGKVYFSAGFDFGINPTLSPPPAWRVFPATEPQFFRPARSSIDYEIEAEITLTWLGVTAAKIAAFRALPQLYNWPLFLYDADSEIWNWKLEHVLIANVQEQILHEDHHNVSIRFYRLKHYR